MNAGVAVVASSGARDLAGVLGDVVEARAELAVGARGAAGSILTAHLGAVRPGHVPEEGPSVAPPAVIRFPENVALVAKTRFTLLQSQAPNRWSLPHVCFPVADPPAQLQFCCWPTVLHCRPSMVDPGEQPKPSATPHAQPHPSKRRVCE